MGQLDGKVALVTGSTRGIGRVVAHQLAKRGAKVVITGRTLEPRERGYGSIRKTEDEIRAAGGEVVGVQADLSEPDEVVRLADKVLARFGGCDLLVNNAADLGRAASHSLEQIELASWDRQFAVNVTAPMLLCQRLVPSMRARGGGRIVNVTSGAGDYNADPGQVPGLAYPATKAALNLMSQRLMRDLRPDNIAVVLMCPGFTASEVMLASLGKSWAGSDDPDLAARRPHSTAVPAGVITHFCTTPDPFAFVGPMHHAAEMFARLGLTEEAA